MSEHDEHVKEFVRFIEKLDKVLIDGLKPQIERQQMEYDGINGTLPGWIPTHYRNDFMRIRSRLLDARGYSHESLMVWLDRYRTHFLLDTETDESFPIMRKYPNGYPLDRLSFMDEIGLLAWLRWCVFDIDRETADKQLDIGFSIAKASKKGLDKRHAPLRETKAHCIEIARRLWIESPDKYGSYSVNDMADALLIHLNHPNHSDLAVPKKKHSIKEWLVTAHENGDLVIPNYDK